MLKFTEVKTGSGKIAVQVFYIYNRKRFIVKHFGTAKTKEDHIKLHLLICFLALVISKHIEIKTGISIRRFNIEYKKVTAAKMPNKLTRKEEILKGKLTEIAEGLLVKLNLLH